LQSEPSPTGDDFPTDGITLNGIKHFIESHGGEQAFTGLRTTDVCDRFLKPSTVDQGESYGGLAKTDPTRNGHIGQATAFVSHAWEHEFLDVVAALEDFDLRQPTPTVFWFDIFSNNQHKAPNREFTWWQTVKLKRTLLVLEWDDPKPLSRAWCLWEMVSTVDTRSEFHVLMSPKNHKSFATALVNDFENIVFKTCNVDLRIAQAFNQSDRDNIFKAVEATAGFGEVNKVVIGIMREWMVESGKGALLGLPEEERAVSNLQNNLATLLYDQGKLSKAEPLFKEALEGRRRTLDNTHCETLTSINNLGMLLHHQGKLSEAEPLFREALEAQRRTLGDTHPDTLTSINNLGLLLQDQGKLIEAEPLFREALKVRRRTLGDTHPDTLISINNLGLLLQDQGKLSEAETLFRDALGGRRRTLGDTHPSTLTSINNLASLLYSQGKLNEAEPLLREALEGRRRTLGDTHPNTLTSINNLASLLETQGKLDEAEPLYREAVSGAKKTAHPTTVIFQKNLARLLQKMGKV